MSQPLRLWLVGDGKAGHENQSLGLADALARLTAVTVERLTVPHCAWTLPRLGDLLRLGHDLAPPDLIVGAGHGTHPALLLLGRRHKVPVVVLMKPTLPTALFDLCLLPRHDLGRGKPPPNVVATLGALNRVVAPPPAPRHHALILVGGPSRQHGFDRDSLLDQIRQVVVAAPAFTWQLTNSRRTPDGFMETLAALGLPLELFPQQQTGPGWVADHLAASRDAWVTEDSVSMVCEALGAGARVGILPMPRLKRLGRVVRGLQFLSDGGYVTSFDDWRKTGELVIPPASLAEADRCARIVLERFFPSRIAP